MFPQKLKSFIALKYLVFFIFTTLSVQRCINVYLLFLHVLQLKYSHVKNAGNWKGRFVKKEAEWMNMLQIKYWRKIIHFLSLHLLWLILNSFHEIQQLYVYMLHTLVDINKIDWRFRHVVVVIECNTVVQWCRFGDDSSFL